MGLRRRLPRADVPVEIVGPVGGELLHREVAGSQWTGAR